MPRPQANPIPLHLSPDLDPDALPRYITAPQCKEIAWRGFGPVSDRTIKESWNLRWHSFNGRSVTDTREFLAECERRFKAAPVQESTEDQSQAAAAADPLSF